MARRRQQEEIQPVATPAFTLPEETTTQKRVIAIRLTDDGKVDVGSMRPKTVEALKQAIAGTPIMESGDTASDTPAFELKKAVYNQIVPALYAVLGAAESLVVAKKTNLPYDEVRSVMAYSELEVQMLQEPTAVVLAKRMPEGFGWTEEVTLALTLVSIHQQKVILLQEMKARAENKIVDIRPSEQAKEATN